MCPTNIEKVGHKLAPQVGYDPTYDILTGCCFTSQPLRKKLKFWLPTTVTLRVLQFWRLTHHFNACGKQSQNGTPRWNRTIIETLKGSCLTFQLWAQKSHNKKSCSGESPTVFRFSWNLSIQLLQRTDRTLLFCRIAV